MLIMICVSDNNDVITTVLPSPVAASRLNSASQCCKPSAVSMTIACEVRFEAAHRLPLVPEGHKCRRLHGHSYRCEIQVTGQVDPDTGWVRDFADLREAFMPLWRQLDHNYLNEVAGLENPTSENIARWIWDRLVHALPGLSCIVVHETCLARCIYTGPVAS